MAISDKTYFVNEEDGEIELEVKLDKASSVPITVDWATEAGSAEADVDYVEASGTLTFAPGDTKKTITVAIIDDDLLEGLDKFTVRLSGTDDALVTLGRSSDEVRIIDGDMATITVAEVTTVDEDAGTVTLTLRASAMAVDAMRFDYRTEDGTAEAGADYTAANGRVTIPAGETERTITITVLDDTADEDREEFKVRLVDAAGDDRDRRLILPTTPASVLIDDDDPEPALSVADAEATEGSALSFTVTLAPPSGREVTVAVATSVETGDTATSGTDFTAKTETLTFAAGDTEKTFTVATAADSTAEDAETFTVTLSGATDAVISDATATGRILPPEVTIVGDKTVVDEDEGAAGFTLSRTGSTAAALTVAVGVTQQADRDLLPDGAAAERTVTFAAGSATAALTVALENDDLFEALGVLTVEVQPGTGYTVGVPALATVDVVDADNTTATPANLTASAGTGPGEVVLSWDAYALHLAFGGHQYQYKTDGAYG